MKEQDLKNIWKSGSKMEEITINLNQLMNDFKYKMKDREEIVRRRDRREIIAAIIGVLGFGYTFYAYPSMISRLGSIIGVLSLIYIIYNLRRNRKSKLMPKLVLPIREQLGYQLQFMHNQYKLLDTVIYWMSTPIFIANALLIWGSFKSDESLTILEQVSTKWDVKLITSLLLATAFGYIGWMNKKAARVNWKPLIQQLNAILKDLREEEEEK